MTRSSERGHVCNQKSSGPSRSRDPNCKHFIDMDSPTSSTLVVKCTLESLILAQDERWRCA